MRTSDYAWIRDYALKDQSFVELEAGFRESAEALRKHQNVIGPVENHQMFIISALLQASEEAKEPLPFLVAPDELRLRRMLPALKAFWPGRIMHFPAREYNLTGAEAFSREQMHQRLACLSAMCSDEPVLFVLSPSALLQPLPPPERFEESLLTLSLCGRLEPQDLAEKLSGLGYEAVSLAEAPGEFSRRGDIVDIIPIDRPQPEEVPEDERLPLYGIRVSFFDDEIDQLRFFDPSDQRQVAAVNPAVIPPAKEDLLRGSERAELAEAVRRCGEEEGQRRYQEGATRTEVQKLRQLCAGDAEKIQSGTDRGLTDRWLWLLYKDKYSVLDYLKRRTKRAVVIETASLSRRMDAAQADREQQILHLLEQGRTTAAVGESFFTRAEIMRQLDREFSCLSFALIHQVGNGFPGGRRFDIRSREAENYRGRDDKFFEMLKGRRDRLESCYVFLEDQARMDRLNLELLKHAPGTVRGLVPRTLPDGFEWPAAGLLVLGAKNIFDSERKRRRGRRSQHGVPIDFFSDLTPGDPVVHEIHGIGIYDGLENLENNGSRRDYIKVRYAGEDVLYLPMEALSQIRKYVGTDGRKPRISRLGGGEWTKLKNRARESIRQLATDLVELYAKRSKLKGFAFPPDTTWDKEFAEAFPFEETDDQLRSIREIKEDMESDKVMDRLLCGDVGFGKTEVAFRAMFKAVNGGRQAALLAPTTVLAQQHYLNFRERVGDFPLRIGHLSRFASESMQKRTIKGLANGEIDVVIGTHRLLSKDVRFRRLGLLVVDEEQRFGVDHKEQIKELYPTVDVLSLSATPIPRTLHMSMSGIRDISVIEEAPADRREVQTFVMEYDDDIIADAIMREVSRGGQVFYLFNNTHKINERARQLEALIPGLRVSVAHGRMNEKTLEDVINAFVEGESDVMVCTTIIESGIDMPNVNTLVVTQADRLGLAQIYQLKGRVGRSGRQAYAYITYEKDKVLKEEAQKRLAAIREFTELGSGFKIALRDLEVRGAGNLLGAEQHGHMEAIGYELYVQMLDEEVKRIMDEQKSEAEDGEAASRSLGDLVQGRVKKLGRAETYRAPEPVETQIMLKLDAYLPASLIPDEGQRMDMYRRLADIQTQADYDDILDELTDRYGDIPRETYTLADISYIQSRAGQMGIELIRKEKKHVFLQFKQGSRPNMEALSALLALPEYKGKIHFNAGLRPHLLWVNQAEPQSALPGKLHRLFAAVEKASAESAAASQKTGSPASGAPKSEPESQARETQDKQNKKKK